MHRPLSLVDLCCLTITKNQKLISGLRELPYDLRDYLLEWLCSHHMLNDENISYFLYPTIGSLTLSDNLMITDVGIEKVGLFVNNSLSSIDFSGCTLTDRTISILNNHFHSLQTVNLSRVEMITDKGIVSLVKSSGATLVNLIFSGCTLITDTCVNCIAENCPKLRSLDLTRCHRVTGKSFLNLSKKCEKLLSVSISRCLDISPESLEKASEYLKKLNVFVVSKCQQFSDNNFCAMIQNMKKLKRLDISGCVMITNQFITQLSENSKRLEMLSISGCKNITNEGMIDLVRSSKKLKTLFLDHCDQLTDIFAIELSKNCIIEGLDISYCSEITDNSIIKFAEKWGTNLRSLNISGCNKVTNVSIEALATNCKSLEVLDLPQSPTITDPTVTLLELSLHNLVRLQLRGLDITQEVVQILPESCPFLRILILSWCSLLREGSNEGWKDAPTFQHLKTLDLSWSEYTKDFMKKISARTPNLQILKLFGCREIDDKAIQIFSGNCPFLLTVQLYGCKYISDNSISHLARNCKNLEFLDINECFRVNDVSIDVLINGFKSLQSLHCRRCPNITKNALKKLKKAKPFVEILN
ncbi:f-box and leucine-rich repeat protein [Anaeramoeba flamelloides]|uniref:F-box and leucine-rich repeat protein n=1 Tax=Anaeramoeba flamelloides TaxID=1746091 RepID=A0AAV7ZC59_9EUKA|nr:f-box and leucine-rich repeat protein [Anaeramoeba flamelloides]KAJ6248967.1 f-box and leucine-rich repeat protein [Anaeramoeba flamelloides]